MNKTLRNLSTNSFILMIGSGINQFLVLLIGLFSARYLGPNQYGIIALASAINIIFIFFIGLGLHHYVTRQVARDISNMGYYYSGIFWIKIILFIPLILMVYFFMVIMGYSQLIVNITVITCISFIINSFVYGFYALIQGHNNMSFIAIGYSLNGILTFLGIAVAIVFHYSIYAFVLIPLLSNLITFFYVTLIIIFKYKLQLLSISMIKAFLKIHLVQAIPFGITGLFVTFYMWSGSFWLSIFYGEEFVGYFNAAFRIVVAAFIVSQGVNMSIYPVLSKIYITDEKATKELYYYQIKILGLSSIIIAVVLYSLSGIIIQVFLGKEFLKSIIIMQILVLIIPLVFIRSSFERILEITGNQIKVTISYALGSILGLLFNIILIFYYAIIGAAIALVLTDFVIFIFTFYQSKKINLMS